MMCYRDRTWCPFWEECKDGQGCDRAMTDKVKADAEKWMKNAPICQYVDKPECYKGICKADKEIK